MSVRIGTGVMNANPRDELRDIINKADSYMNTLYTTSLYALKYSKYVYRNIWVIDDLSATISDSSSIEHEEQIRIADAELSIVWFYIVDDYLKEVDYSVIECRDCKAYYIEARYKPYGADEEVLVKALQYGKSVILLDPPDFSAAMTLAADIIDYKKRIVEMLSDRSERIQLLADIIEEVVEEAEGNLKVFASTFWDDERYERAAVPYDYSNPLVIYLYRDGGRRFEVVWSPNLPFFVGINGIYANEPDPLYRVLAGAFRDPRKGVARIKKYLEKSSKYREYMAAAIIAMEKVYEMMESGKKI